MSNTLLLIFILLNWCKELNQKIPYFMIGILIELKIMNKIPIYLSHKKKNIKIKEDNHNKKLDKSLISHSQ